MDSNDTSLAWKLGYNAALEEAAKVADWQAIHISQGHGQITPCECAEIADRIAAAIRALKDKP